MNLAVEPSRGWGGPVALLVAAAVFFFVIVPLAEWAKSRWGVPSPTKALPRGARVKPQAIVVPDTGDTNPDTKDWFGRIITTPAGQRVRQVWRTGSSRLPNEEPVDEAAEVADDELDLALDEPDPEPETLEEWVARVDREGLAYAEIVRQGMATYRVSERTVKRRIADLRAAGKGAAAE